MAEITTTQAFSDGDTVTATKLNNITGNAAIQTEAITNRSAETTVDQANDLLLMYDASATALKKVTLSNVIKAGTASNFPVTGNATIGGTLGVTGVVSAASTIELGHASDTTLARGAAGRITVEGVNVPTISSTDTLTNKTLTSPVISTISNTGTLTLPTSTDTLVGRATTDTLTNKTLTSPAISGGTINNAAIGGTTPAAGAFTTLSSTGNTTIGDASADTLTVNATSTFAAKPTVQISSATTNSVSQVLRLNSQSSGTPANGIGVGLEFAAETSAGNTEVGATIEAITTDVTSTSEDFDLSFKTMAAGAAAAERMRVKSDGSLQFNSGYGSVATAYGVRAWAIIDFDQGVTGTYSRAANVNGVTTVTLTSHGYSAGNTINITATTLTTGSNQLFERSYTIATVPTSSTFTFNADDGAGGYYGSTAATGNVTIRKISTPLTAGGNVSSITDNGVGLLTVNFTTAMPNANYAVKANAKGPTPTYGSENFVGVDLGTLSTSSVSLRLCRVTFVSIGVGSGTQVPTWSLSDSNIVCVSVIR